MQTLRSPETVPLWGEALCLDYANSVDWSPSHEHIDPDHTDVLRTQDMLLRWGRRTGLLTHDATRGSEIEFGRALGLRDSVYRIFAAIADDDECDDQDLAVLMRNFRDAATRARLVEDGPGYRLGWPPDVPQAIRYAVSTNAVALLEDPARLRRVTRCPGRNCGWLFLNTSGRRRWCSMSTCGSRDKMRRLHQRRKEPDPSQP